MYGGKREREGIQMNKTGGKMKNKILKRDRLNTVNYEHLLSACMQGYKNHLEKLPLKMIWNSCIYFGI